MKVKKGYQTDVIYKDIVSSYLSYMKETMPNIEPHALSELLRYAMCLLLGLESKGYDSFIEHAVSGVVVELEPVIDKYGLEYATDEYKRGILEACVHCIEIPIKMVRKELAGI